MRIVRYAENDTRLGQLVAEHGIDKDEALEAAVDLVTSRSREVFRW